MGLTPPAAAQALGRTYWIQVFAEAKGFSRDFTQLLDSYGLTWEEAAQAPVFTVNPFDREVGTRTAMLVIKFGAESFCHPSTLQATRKPRPT